MQQMDQEKTSRKIPDFKQGNVRGALMGFGLLGLMLLRAVSF